LSVPHTHTEHGLRFPPQCRISCRCGYYLTHSLP
jgi:hypothetical protein